MSDSQGNSDAVRSHTVETDKLIVMDIHSHGRSTPFFSPTDDQDETRLRFYGVIGSLDNVPRFTFRLGMYGLPSPTIQDPALLRLFTCRAHVVFFRIDLAGCQQTISYGRTFVARHRNYYAHEFGSLRQAMRLCP
jgi:hypothetical protein